MASAKFAITIDSTEAQRAKAGLDAIRAMATDFEAAGAGLAAEVKAREAVVREKRATLKRATDDAAKLKAASLANWAKKRTETLAPLAAYHRRVSAALDVRLGQLARVKDTLA